VWAVLRTGRRIIRHLADQDIRAALDQIQAAQRDRQIEWMGRAIEQLGQRTGTQFDSHRPRLTTLSGEVKWSDIVEAAKKR
jgi:hypothetical protein